MEQINEDLQHDLWDNHGVYNIDETVYILVDGVFYYYSRIIEISFYLVKNPSK